MGSSIIDSLVYRGKIAASMYLAEKRKTHVNEHLKKKKKGIKNANYLFKEDVWSSLTWSDHSNSQQAMPGGLYTLNALPIFRGSGCPISQFLGLELGPEKS